MWKRILLAIVAVFVIWTALDFVIHNLILGPTYEATAKLWRPMDQMKMGLMQVVGIVGSCLFVLIYALLIRPKSLAAAVKYGLLFGLATGIPMGFGTYSYMDIPIHLAVVWAVGSLVKAVAGAVAAGFIIGRPKA